MSALGGVNAMFKGGQVKTEDGEGYHIHYEYQV